MLARSRLPLYGWAPQADPFRWSACSPHDIRPDQARNVQETTVTRILLLHGPNLSQLGSRDPAQYGTATLDEVVAAARAEATPAGADVEHFQTEHEGLLLERLHTARTDGTAAVIINAGAWTHTSYALHDALELLEVPKIELHLSNIHAREAFRSTSVIAPVCDGSIAGFGIDGYPLAVRAALDLLGRRA